MTPEIGQILLALALAVAVVQSFFPLVGAQRGIVSWVALAKPAARLMALLMVSTFCLLAYSFLVHDYSIAYVAENSNNSLPTQYLITAVWGAHEGSLLLWATILSLWGLAVSYFNRGVPEVMVARVLGVMGLICLGFLLFMTLTSNPFGRMVPPPANGQDLNPLLQDPGMVIHPPMLYMGYVGFSVPFAFAIAAMLGGRLDAAWARWSRPWTNVAWLFLTIGITLGSWWAYYELGWGGWWFWDPVENASFMPWLAGTALMHSLAVTEKRGAFKAWTVLLAIFTFSLSLLGTFLVRSGILTSVHAFASDPKRGVFILILLSIVVGSSLLLYAARANSIKSSVRFEMVSRETGLLVNNVILAVTSVAIMIGTLYPLIADALQMGKISVGRPYFDTVFIILTVPLVILMGFGPLARWRQDSISRLVRRLLVAAVVSIAIGVIWIAAFTPHVYLMGIVGVSLGIWVLSSTVVAIRDRLRPHGNWRHIPRGFWGMVIGHLGITVFVIGVTLTSLYSTERDVRLAPGQHYDLAGYTFTFHGTQHVQGPNYSAIRGDITVTHDGETVARMYPEKRDYPGGMPMTEAAINPGLTRDLFAALGADVGDKAWSLRLYHKPFVRWLWLGGVIMAIGGLLAATDRRYRVLARRSTLASDGSQPA